jgi:hypothetical protein
MSTEKENGEPGVGGGSHATPSDEEFLARFEAHELDGFSHRDHLRMAFAYARRGGLPAAVDGARRLRGLAEAHGAPGKYHETMTVAWARVVGGLALAHPSLEFPELLAEHPELLRRDLLSSHYSRDVLFSDAARVAFVAPDRRPLP